MITPHGAISIGSVSDRKLQITLKAKWRPRCPCIPTFRHGCSGGGLDCNAIIV